MAVTTALYENPSGNVVRSLIQHTHDLSVYALSMPYALKAVHPVLCREVVERQQFVPILGQAFHRLGVFGSEALQRAVEGLMGCLASLHQLKFPVPLGDR